MLAGVRSRLRASELAPASTLLGVAALGFAGQLVEIDLTAAPTDQDVRGLQTIMR